MSLPNSTFDSSKNYTDVIFREDRDLLSSELNELQDLTNWKAKQAYDILFREGGRLDGTSLTTQPHPTDLTKVRCQVTAGKIYTQGKVYDIAATFVDVPNTGIHNIGLLLTETDITATDPINGDPTLVNPQTGDLVAERNRAIVTWVVDNASAVRVFTITNGVLTVNDLPPDLNAALALDVRRTNDLVGNCLVNGGKSRGVPKDTGHFQVVTSPLKGYVEGFELVLPSPTYTVMDYGLDTQLILEESGVFVTGTNQYTIASNPVATLDNVFANVSVTTNVTRGQANTADLLPFTPVVSIQSVTQGGTTYVANTDFQRNGNQVDWSLLGAEPTVGSTYTVVYTYNKHMVVGVDYQLTQAINTFKQIFWEVDFNLAGDKPVNGSTFTYDYHVYLGRRDVVALDRLGNLVWLRGIPGPANHFPPAVPPDCLKVCDVIVPAGPYFENIKVIDTNNYVLSALEIRDFLQRFENLEYNMGLEDLDKDVLTNEQITNKRGIFTDSFKNSDKGDIYARLVDPILAPTLYTTTTGGTLPAATTFYVKYAWGNKNGATLVSNAANITTGAGVTNAIQVFIPPRPLLGCTRVYVYASTDQIHYYLVTKLESFPTETPPERNLIFDEGFELNSGFVVTGQNTDSKYWHGVYTGVAAGTFKMEATTGMIDAQVSFHSITTNGGGSTAAITLYNDGNSLSKTVVLGERYRMTFTAYAASGRTIIVSPVRNATNGDLAGTQTVTLTTSAAVYTYDFVATTSDVATKFGVFLLGNSTVDVFIDDVSVSKLTQLNFTAPIDSTQPQPNAISTAFSFTAAYGLQQGIMCNGITKYIFDMDTEVDLPHTTAVHGAHWWTLPYTFILGANQPRATNIFPVNPYEVFNRATVISLFPTQDVVPQQTPPPFIPPQPIQFPPYCISCDWNALNAYYPKVQPDTVIRIMTKDPANGQFDNLLFQSPWNQQGGNLLQYLTSLSPDQRYSQFGLVDPNVYPGSQISLVNNVLTINTYTYKTLNLSWQNQFNVANPVTNTTTSTSPTTGNLPTNDATAQFIAVRTVGVTGGRFISNAQQLHASFAGEPIDLVATGSSVAGPDWQDPRTNRFYHTVNADVNGHFTANFKIPAGIPAGDRDIIIENDLNKGITIYSSNGSWQQRPGQIVQIGNATTTAGVFNKFTPIAQSFQYDTDRIIGKIDLFFESKSTSDSPVTIQIRDMINGYPGTNVFASSTVPASAVAVSSNGSVATTFTLDDLFWVKANTTYCIAVITDSIEYNVWVGTLGLTDVVNNLPISSNPFVGIMFASSNNTTWTAYQTTYVKFNLWEASFTSPAVINFVNLTGFTAATFFVSLVQLLPPNTSVMLEMSEDNGLTWQQFNPLTEVFYPALATESKLRITLASTTSQLSPFVGRDALQLSNFVWFTDTVYISKNIDYSLFNTTFDTINTYLYEKIPTGGMLEVWVSHNNGTNWFLINQGNIPDTFVRPIDGAWADHEMALDMGPTITRNQFRIALRFKTTDGGLRPICVGRLRTAQTKQH